MSIKKKESIKISVIIPVLNEEKNILNILNHIESVKEKNDPEIIVVDGDEKGSTIKHIKNKKIIALKSRKGRAVQMNKGASAAKGNVLLFLHADTYLPADAFNDIERVMRSSLFAGGAFDLGIDSRHFAYRLISFFTSLRSRITRIPFGDQAIFTGKEYFEKLGGYRDIPIMEDIQFMRNVKKYGGKIFIIKKKTLTSPRKWDKEGIIFTSIRNIILQLLYYAGMPPEKLARYYYRNYNS